MSKILAVALISFSFCLSAPAFAEDDCQYIPRTQSGVDFPVRNMMGGAWVHEVHLAGCKPQCIARVFCHSTSGLTEPFSKIPMQKRFDKAIPLNCDANPSAVDIGPDFAPSCPPADECMAAYKKEAFRKAVPTKPNPGADSYTHGGVTFHVQYGLNRAHPELDAQIPLYSFPALNGAPSDECKICASPVNLAEAAWSHTACPANTEEPLGCRNANDCSNYKNDDPTAPAIGAFPVQPQQIIHVAPTSGTAPKGADAGAAKIGDHK